MKSKDKQAVEALLLGALHDIVAAARIVNQGSPAPKDITELMASWASIAKVVSHPRSEKNRAFTTAQLAMLDALIGAAA